MKPKKWAEMKGLERLTGAGLWGCCSLCSLHKDLLCIFPVRPFWAVLKVLSQTVIS